MGKLKASVQYDDWKGTVAADDAHPRAIRDFLTEKGLYDPKHEFLVAIDLFIGENQGGKVQQPMISALICDRATDFESTRAQLTGQPDPIPLKEVEAKLTMNEFLGLFKRFSMVLVWKGLPIDGREYTT